MALQLPLRCFLVFVKFDEPNKCELLIDLHPSRSEHWDIKEVVGTGQITTKDPSQASPQFRLSSRRGKSPGLGAFLHSLPTMAQDFGIFFSTNLTYHGPKI